MSHCGCIPRLRLELQTLHLSLVICHWLTSLWDWAIEFFPLSYFKHDSQPPYTIVLTFCCVYNMNQPFTTLWRHIAHNKSFFLCFSRNSRKRFSIFCGSMFEGRHSSVSPYSHQLVIRVHIFDNKFWNFTDRKKNTQNLWFVKWLWEVSIKQSIWNLKTQHKSTRIKRNYSMNFISVLFVCQICSVRLYSVLFSFIAKLPFWGFFWLSYHCTVLIVWLIACSRFSTPNLCRIVGLMTIILFTKI